MGFIWSILKIFLAGVLGGIIGFEREKTDKPAGLRTLMLVCVGSTAFTVASIELAKLSQVADPGRVAAGVVSGIGFLGAGAILRGNGSVHGLTTAAAIWATAAVGILVGTGQILESFVLTGLVYYILRYLPSILERELPSHDEKQD